MGRVVAAALTAASVLLLIPGAPAQDPPTFKVDVKLVRLLATVKDASGQLIGGLKREDFAVHDNDVRQEIAVFERHTEQPLSVSVLVDTSASTAKDLPYEVDSVARFFRALFREGNPKDAASLYSFTHDVTLRASFTRNQRRLEAELKQLRPQAGTSLYDAIWLAAQPLEDREGRHVMILVTDGGDTTSVKRFADALEAAHRADAVLYSILVVPIENDAGRNTGGENALTMLSAGTGGRVFTPSTGPQLDAAFDEILRDLRTQYLLGYYPRNIPLTRERFHRVRVEIPSRPGLRVFTRSGYYGDYDPSFSIQPRGRSNR
jgi:Ca-activated chloride channel family protein